MARKITNLDFSVKIPFKDRNEDTAKLLAIKFAELAGTKSRPKIRLNKEKGYWGTSHIVICKGNRLYSDCGTPPQPSFTIQEFLNFNNIKDITESIRLKTGKVGIEVKGIRYDTVFYTKSQTLRVGCTVVKKEGLKQVRDFLNKNLED